MAMRETGGPLADEDGAADERDRYRELLEEIRTVLPGVQVLFAFLLAAPFSPRFPELVALERDLYGAALTGAALATVLLMAPTSFHRLGARTNRAARVRIAIALAIGGMLTLALAILSAILAVLRFVFDGRTATIVTASLATVIALLWYVLPLLTRAVGGRTASSEPADPHGGDGDRSGLPPVG